MAVYVDAPVWRFGRMIMCHMVADTPEELRAMALRIGVALKWFQCDASLPHFDICKSKRALAIKAGAVECDRRQFVATFPYIRSTWPRDSRGRWRFPRS